MFSTYALQGIEHKKNGAYTREELAPLAETNVTSLKEYNYFNYARVDGKKRKDAFDDPVDYWLDYTDSVLTLHFTLPLKAPVRARDLEIDVYDPEYFIDFGFDEKEPGQARQCAGAMHARSGAANGCSSLGPASQQIIPGIRS